MLARLFAARLQKVPLCLLLDDAHTLSSDALALVSRLAHGVPQLLVIMAQRPKRATASPASPKPAAADGGSPGGAPSDDDARGSLQSIAEVLAVRGLGEDDESALLQTLLGVAALPAGLAAAVRARSAGNPYFAKEVLHSLTFSGQLTVEDGACVVTGGGGGGGGGGALALEMPRTLHALALARVDSLAAEALLALKVAAAIGKSFDLAELAPPPPRAFPTRCGPTAPSRSGRRQCVVNRSFHPSPAAPRRVRTSLCRSSCAKACTRRFPSRCAVRSTHPSPRTPSPRWRRSGTMHSALCTPASPTTTAVRGWRRRRGPTC